MPVACVGASEEAAVGTDAVVENHPLAAAELALASLLVVQRHLFDVQAVARLGDLRRAVEGVARAAAEQRVVAVTVCRCAPAADLRLDDREVPARVWMTSPDVGAAHRCEAAGREPRCDLLAEAAP